MPTRSHGRDNFGGEGEAVPRPYGRPRSFMPTRSFMAGTNKSRGMESARRKISLGWRNTYLGINPHFSVCTCHIYGISSTILSAT